METIDINQPVKEGYDMVLNYDQGGQKLGSAGGYEREANKGLLRGTPDNASNLNRVGAREEEVVIGGTNDPVRDKNGRFTKK